MKSPIVYKRILEIMGVHDDPKYKVRNSKEFMLEYRRLAIEHQEFEIKKAIYKKLKGE